MGSMSDHLSYPYCAETPIISEQLVVMPQGRIAGCTGGILLRLLVMDGHLTGLMAIRSCHTPHFSFPFLLAYDFSGLPRSDPPDKADSSVSEKLEPTPLVFFRAAITHAID